MDVLKQKNRLQKNSLVVSITLIASLLAFVVGVITNISYIKNLITPTPTEKEILLKKVESLAPGVDINVYKDAFGNPTFTDQDEKQGLKELVFISKYFYLDAIADKHGKVIYFAITTRDSTFNPIFISPNVFTTAEDPKEKPYFKIRLGITKFADLTDITFPPEKIDCRTDEHSFFQYYEIYDLHRDGDFRDYGFGINEAGYISQTALDPIMSTIRDNCMENITFTENNFSKLKNLRTNAAINTYATSFPFAKIRENMISGQLGVNYYQIKLIK